MALHLLSRAPVARRPVGVWLETTLVVLLVPALGLWLNPADPLFVRSAFPWAVLAPLLVGLRYGFAPRVRGRHCADVRHRGGLEGGPAAAVPGRQSVGRTTGGALAVRDRGRRVQWPVASAAGNAGERARPPEPALREPGPRPPDAERLARSAREPPRRRSADAARSAAGRRRPGAGGGHPAGAAGPANPGAVRHLRPGPAGVAVPGARTRRRAVRQAGRGAGARARAVRSRRRAGAAPPRGRRLRFADRRRQGQDRGPGAVVLAAPLEDCEGRLWGLLAVCDLPFSAYGAEGRTRIAALAGHVADLLAFGAPRRLAEAHREEQREAFTRRLRRAAHDRARARPRQRRRAVRDRRQARVDDRRDHRQAAAGDRLRADVAPPRRGARRSRCCCR